jgi:cellulose synthase/poly-beta-1,6-N-acetylglucosamine synthase-like glycosyltransferase
MRRPHYTALFVSGLIVILFLGVVLVGVTLSLLGSIQLQNTLIRVTVVVLLIFLGTLVLRYISLLWLSYLQHTEESLRQEQVQSEETVFQPPVTIIVPAFNEGVVVQAALRSLLQLDYPRYEVIVIDDGSTDDTFEKARAMEGEFGSAVIRVVRKSNGGKASALNLGISLARHPFVLCMDGDSTLSVDTLQVAIDHFRDPRVAAVAGNVKVANRINFWTKLQALEYIEGLNMPRRAQAFMRAVNIIPGPIGIFRREVLLEVEGYDVDTFAEDADLTLKILAAGWRIVYEERAIAYTEAPANLLALIKQRYRWTRGVLQAVAKHRDILWSLNSDRGVWLSLAMMIFEAMIWPFMNVVGHLFFVLIALAYGAGPNVASWWLLLTLLDVAAALHTVAIEEEDLRLVPLAVVYRIFFILLIDVAKLLASIEEALKLEMTWGKLERTGGI